MDYDTDYDESEADPQHCTAVLRQWKEELQDRMSDLIKEFEKRTDLKLIAISFMTTPDCANQETFGGVKLQFDL